MVKVKICGIKMKIDVSCINKYLPEYAGFVFASSARQVDAQTAKALAAYLDDRIKKVGVFVNENVHRVVEIAAECGLDAVQVHGDEPPVYFAKLRELLCSKPVEIWKAMRVKDRDTINEMSCYDVDAFVLDAYNENSYGGAGKAFDWDIAAKAGKRGRIILAGGLNPQNVSEAVRIVRPFAVDVSSGVETGGYKDISKIRDFINAARGYHA